MGHPESRRSGRRPASRTALAIVGLIALVGLGSGCATRPPHDITAPGTYTIDFSAPTLWNPQGFSPASQVVVCIDRAMALGFSSDTNLYEAKVEWSDGTHHFPTPVLQPGCGLLRLVVPCCYVPPSVEVTLSEL